MVGVKPIVTKEKKYRNQCGTVRIPFLRFHCGSELCCENEIIEISLFFLHFFTFSKPWINELIEKVRVVVMDMLMFDYPPKSSRCAFSGFLGSEFWRKEHYYSVFTGRFHYRVKILVGDLDGRIRVHGQGEKGFNSDRVFQREQILVKLDHHEFNSEETMSKSRSKNFL